MKVTSSKVILALLLFSIALSHEMPIIMVPGLGSSCKLEEESETGAIFRLKAAFTKSGQTENPIHCIPYNTAINGNIDNILTKLCEFTDSKLQEWGLKNGFIGIGLSQGGLFARHIL